MASIKTGNQAATTALKSTSTGSLSKGIGTQRASKSSATHNVVASQISVSAENVSATNVKDAIEEINARAISVANDAPTNSVGEGNLWYDADDDVMYVRDEDSWNEIHVSGRTTLDGGTFT